MHESDLLEAKVLGHEPEGVDVRWIWLSAAVLIATVVFSLGLMRGLLNGIVAMDGKRDVAPEKQVPMAAGVPELDANQVVEMERLRKLEAQLLDNYEWIDQATGIARIPIERAMAIAAEKGLNAINAAEATGAATVTETTSATPTVTDARANEQSAPAAPVVEANQPESQTNE